MPNSKPVSLEDLPLEAWTVSPALFAHGCSHRKWLAYEYLIVLSDVLIKVAAGQIKHLMIFMPPRHGKSEMVSKYFTAWFLGHNPDKRVIFTSYEAEFAASWGRKARNILTEYGPTLFNVEVSSDSSAASSWDIAKHSGGMSTAGVGGPITGKGAHLLIIDDPVKNAEEANSKTMRDKAVEWYKSTAYTRLEPGGAVIIIQTRWHEDDLSGRLLQEEPDKWTVISFPALAEEGDPLNRQPGEPLSPRRYDATALEEIKATLGSYWWNALYQQHPQPLEGAIFKRQHFRYCTFSDGLYDLGPKKVKHIDCRIFQTCDPAASTKTTADYFVLSTWAQTPDNDLILLDVLRTRLEGPDQIPLFKQQYHRWNPVFQAVESKGLGITLYQMLVREGLPVRELKADKDKVTRALPAAARMESGSVYFLQGAPWLGDFEQELLSFPTGAHDDQVDTMSYAVQMIVKKQIGNFDLSALIRTKPR
jgi:predicted phage terminase large subunit-like protein